MLSVASIRPRLLFVVALTAIAGALALASFTAANAQFLPSVLYGKDMKANALIEVSIGGKACNKVRATDKGEWVVQIAANAPCAPTEGAAITFTVEGRPATASPAAQWHSGGIPVGSVADGYKLAIEGEAGGATGGSTASSDSGDDSGGGSSPILFIIIGVVVVAAIGGGVYMMQQRSRTTS